MNSRTKAVQALYQLLENGTEADRCFCCRALGVLQDNNNIEKISRYLQDDDIDVCIDAATALGQIADHQAVPFLLESMQQDPDGEVRTAVIEALGNIPEKTGNDRVIPALLNALSKRPENLEWDNNWDPWWDIQLKAITALGLLRAKDAVPIILDMLLDDEFQDMETELLKALAQIGGIGISSLMQYFSQGNSRMRRRVMIALRFCTQKQIGRELASGIKDYEAEVRQATIQTLAELNTKHFLGALFLLIKDPDPDVRASAIKAIFKITRNPDNTPDNSGSDNKNYDLTNNQLMVLLDDDDNTVRYIAAKVLITINRNSFTDSDYETIMTKLDDNDPRVVITICKLLGQLKNKEALFPLIKILRDNSKETGLRQHAALALGSIGCDEQHVISVLVENINNQHQIVRLAALTALNELDKQQQNNRSQSQLNDTAMDAIINALKEKPETTTPKTRNNEIENTIDDIVEIDITTLQHQQVSSTLDSITRDNVLIALALQEPDQQAVKKPEIQCEHNDPALKEFADIVKQNNDTGEWLGALKTQDNTLNKHKDIRYLAARILADSDRPDAVTALINSLSDKDAELRRESANSLAQIASRNPKTKGIKNSFGSLMLQLETGTHEIRLACVRALAALGNIEALPAIIESLQDKDSAVRIESIIALHQLLISKQHSSTHRKTSNAIYSEQIAEQVIENILLRLDDAASGVRMNAANTLMNILKKDITLKQSYHDIITTKVIATAFKGDGGQARHMAKILREINIDYAARQVIPMLTTLKDSSERRFAIEILEELFKPKQINQDQPTTERAA